MWDRAILKGNARLAISGQKYWTAFAVCLVFSLITGVLDIITRFSEPELNFSMILSPGYLQSYVDQVNQNGAWTNFPNFLLWLFITLPLTVGVARFFVRNRFGQTRFNTLFSPFHSSYASTMGGMFTTALINILWFVVFIIPGFIKALQYWMVPFLLSDNPSLPGARARKLSRMMTDGEKGAIFVLFLSFLGWYILAGIVINTISWICWPVSELASTVILTFVTVYVQATFAELYIFLRDRAIQNGMIQPAELGLVPPAV